MKLRIDFGHDGSKHMVSWWQPILDFPKLLQFSGLKWEWVVYDRDSSGENDYILMFGRIPMHDPNYYTTIPDFNDLFPGSSKMKCECGAHFTSFPQKHMSFCPLWRD